MVAIGYGETVEHVRWLKDERNAHNQLKPVFAEPESGSNVGVHVPSPTEKVNGIDHRQVVVLVAFLPAGYTVEHRDKLIIRGQEYAVVGDAPPLTNFYTGTPFLTETKLKRETG